MVDHAHVPGIEDIRPLLILKHGEILPRALFLHQRILVAAGLGAGAPVGVPPGHVVGQQTPPGIGHTHGPVAEYLQLQLRRDPLPDGPNLLQAQLPGQHHPAGPQVIPGLGTGVVGHRLLGADVPLAVGCILSRQGKGPQVRQDQGIHPGITQLLQIGRQLIRLAPAGHGVHCSVDGHTVVMGVTHRPGQLLRGKIPCKGPHPEGRTRQIHSVRPV